MFDILTPSLRSVVGFDIKISNLLERLTNLTFNKIPVYNDSDIMSLTDFAKKTSMRLSGRLYNHIFYVVAGEQCVRSHTDPENPQTEIQQNNRHAFRLCKQKFSELSGQYRLDWIKLSHIRRIPDPAFFVKCGMLSYISQLGVEVTPESVEVVGVYPYDVWGWEPVEE